MNPFTIQLYRDSLLQLKRGNFKGIVSNAKPIAILSIFNAISDSAIEENKIFFDSLIAYYQRVNEIYGISKITPLSYPFYHLSREPFYHIKWEGQSIRIDAPSAKFVREHINYAYLDEELWELLQVYDVREEFRKLIEDYYLR